MSKKALIYASIISAVYIFVVGFLGLAVRDDFLALTFPSWPFLIDCFENCGYLMLIALFANGILVGALSFVIISLASFFLTRTRRLLGSSIDRKPGGNS